MPMTDISLCRMICPISGYFEAMLLISANHEHFVNHNFPSVPGKQWENIIQMSKYSSLALKCLLVEICAALGYWIFFWRNTCLCDTRVSFQFLGLTLSNSLLKTKYSSLAAKGLTGTEESLWVRSALPNKTYVCATFVEGILHSQTRKSKE